MAPAPRTPGIPNAAPRVDFFRSTALEEGDDSQTQLVKIMSLHNVSFSQLLIQESMMRGQILPLRAQEGHAKLIVNSIQKLVDSFQRIDPLTPMARLVIVAGPAMFPTLPILSHPIFIPNHRSTPHNLPCKARLVIVAGPALQPTPPFHFHPLFIPDPSHLHC